jgi:hypothetical protein
VAGWWVAGRWQEGGIEGEWTAYGSARPGLGWVFGNGLTDSVGWVVPSCSCRVELWLMGGAVVAEERSVGRQVAVGG